VKTAENAYRDVQIAFANEIALICEKLGADAFKVRELVNKCPFRDMHIPGAGVGGHCIPKDPWLLAYGVRGKMETRLLALSRQINDYMPEHMVELVRDALGEAKKELTGAKITVFGLAFLPDSDDLRNSPAIPVVRKLKGLGCEVVVHDPFVLDFYLDHYKLKGDGFSFTRDAEKALRGSDCAVIITLHSEYKKFDLGKMTGIMRTKVIVDGRNLFDKNKCGKAGFVYRGIGK